MKRKKTVEIPLEKVEFGISLILNNAREFVKEAGLLLNTSWTKHAVGLLELAIQELGKATLLKQRSNEQMKLRMEEIKEGKVLTSRSVRMPEFYDHVKKHDAGIRLLPENAHKIEQRVFSPFSAGGFASKDVEIDESLRLRSLYVDWENGDWKIPSPTMIIGDKPSEKLLDQLRILADAVEKAANELIHD